MERRMCRHGGSSRARKGGLLAFVLVMLAFAWTFAASFATMPAQAVAEETEVAAIDDQSATEGTDASTAELPSAADEDVDGSEDPTLPGDDSDDQTGTGSDSAVSDGEDGEPAADPDQPAADPEQPTADPESPAADPDQPSTDADKPVADPEQPATEADKPSTDTDKPAADGEQPAPKPLAPAEALALVLTDDATPEDGGVLLLGFALSDRTALASSAQLTLVAASGEVCVPLTRASEGYLFFSVPCSLLGQGRATLSKLEVALPEDASLTVDFSLDGLDYSVEVVPVAEPEPVDEAPEASEGPESEGASVPAITPNPLADARAWFPAADEPALRLVEGDKIELDPTVKQAFIELGMASLAFEAPLDPNAAEAVLPSSSTLFSDTPANAWYVKDGYLDYVTAAGLMSGYNATSFGPEDTLTRAQVVTILYRYADPSGIANTTNSSKFGKTSRFYDVPTGVWYTAAVEWAWRNGVTTGYGTGGFGPNDPITREDLVTMLYRFAACCGVGGSLADISGYPDSGSVSGYARNAVRWANARGIFTGDASTSPARLRPGYNVSRAEMAKMVTVLVRDVLSGAVPSAPSWSMTGVSSANKYVVAGGTVKVTASVSGDKTGLTYTYRWDCNGESWESEPTTSSSYNFYLGGTGEFKITCTVTDEQGHKDSRTCKVTSWKSMTPYLSSDGSTRNWTTWPNFGIGSANGFTIKYTWKRGEYQSSATTLSSTTGGTSNSAYLGNPGYYWIEITGTDPEGHTSTASERFQTISWSGLNMLSHIEGEGSPTGWYLVCDYDECKVGVFKKTSYGWELAAEWDCSPGAYDTPTVHGRFSVYGKTSYFDSDYPVRCFYATMFYGAYYFHSTLYYQGYTPDYPGPSYDGRLGMHLSHGCIRLAYENAKWIYGNIPIGTPVLVY